MVGLNATTIKLGLNLQALKWAHTHVCTVIKKKSDMGHLLNL